MEKKQEEHSPNEEPMEQQPKLDETKEEEKHDDQQGEEGQQQPNEEEFKPELACEVYAALPAAHQRRLVLLSNVIWEKGTSADEFTKWKILQWSGNRWQQNRPSQSLQISADGLSVTDNHEGDNYQLEFTVRAVHGVQFPPTRLEGPQICYFETTHLEGGFFLFGYCAQDSRWGNHENVFAMFSHGESVGGDRAEEVPFSVEDNEVATIGCGLIKHLGQRKIFFTKNGQVIAKPFLLPSTAPNVLFPFIWSPDSTYRFENTNFGLRPFQCTYAGNEEKLADTMNWRSADEDEE